MLVQRHVGLLRRYATRFICDGLRGHVRTASNLSDLLSGQFTVETRKSIEDYWKPLIGKLDAADNCRHTGEKYYVLSMFPYPSGKLHMGHVRVYTISDAMARYQRMHGKQVIHPMGWDAFGLPAENAAIERAVPPDKWTKSNIEHMRSQLKYMCYSFDWDREVATCDPDYYKWTQHIFLRMFHKGLVYRRASRVNWDPLDRTVLADEQIDEQGRSWRSGAMAETRYLRQWFFKTTALAKSLLDGLDDVRPDLWRDVIKLQRHWIGACVGTKLDFKIQSRDSSAEGEVVTVYTETPELLSGASHIAVRSDHWLNHKYGRPQNQVLDVVAVNPMTGDTLPIIVSSQLESTQSETKLGILCIDDEARSTAQLNNLPVTPVLDTDGDLTLTAGPWKGLGRDEARRRAMEHARTHGYGGHVTSERLNDWLISRQRYWGTPIPIIHCPDCGAVPVPYEDLPVRLPSVAALTGKGDSPLASDESWNRVPCPSCKGPAVRETDTMDTFVDSSWYYLRYLDPRNENEPFSAEAAETGMPVDLYIGGKEHATLHLYFARFFMHFLHAEGLVPCREPFHNLLTQGMVLGQAYRVRQTGAYLREDQVDFSGGAPREKLTGAPVEAVWEKMSKSKHNGVDPETVLSEYGVDSTRLCILGGVAPKSDRKWQPDFFKGIVNWQTRIWVMVSDFIKARRASESGQSVNGEHNYEAWERMLFDKRNYYLNEYMFHMESTFMISSGMSRMQMFTNDLKKIPPKVMAVSSEFSRCLSLLVMMVAPLAPMFASELWSAIGTVAASGEGGRDWSRGVLEQRWPPIDAEYMFPITVRGGHDELYTARVPYHQVPALDRDSVLDIVRSHHQFDQFRHDIVSLRPDITPGLRIDVHANLKKKAKKLSNR